MKKTDSVVELHEQSAVVAPHDAADEVDGRLLLESQLQANTAARVDEEADVQGLVALSREVGELLGNPVLIENEAFLGQVGHEAPLPVRHRHENVDRFHVDADLGILEGGQEKKGDRSAKH